MTKIFCPIEGCNKSHFGVLKPHQTHLNIHLQQVHGIEVTPANLDNYRNCQDETWQARVELLEAERSAQAKRMREEWEAFSKDPTLPLPTEDLDNDKEEQLNEFMDTHDDKEPEDEAVSDGGPSGRESKAANEWFGSGPDYDVSFRTYRSRSQRDKEEEAARMEVTRILSGSMRQGVGLPGGKPSAPSEKEKERATKDRDSPRG